MLSWVEREGDREKKETKPKKKIIQRFYFFLFFFKHIYMDLKHRVDQNGF